MPYSASRKDELGIIADLNIASAETGYVFRDNDSDLTRFNQPDSQRETPAKRVAEVHKSIMVIFDSEGCAI